MGTVGPVSAVGRGTSIAMVGAYVLAQELAQAGRNYQTGLRALRGRVRELAARARSSVYRLGLSSVWSAVCYSRSCLEPSRGRRWMMDFERVQVDLRRAGTGPGQ